MLLWKIFDRHLDLLPNTLACQQTMRPIVGFFIYLPSHHNLSNPKTLKSKMVLLPTHKPHMFCQRNQSVTLHTNRVGATEKNYHPNRCHFKIKTSTCLVMLHLREIVSSAGRASHTKRAKSFSCDYDGSNNKRK